MLYLNSLFERYCITNNREYWQGCGNAFWLEYINQEIFPTYTLFVGRDEDKKKYQCGIYNKTLRGLEIRGYKVLELEQYSLIKEILNI